MLNAIALMLATLTPGSYEYAMVQAEQCETPTSWAEQVAPGVFVGMCGDDDGNEANSCNELAELHYAMSDERDSAWEDAYADCSGTRADESDDAYHATVDAWCKGPGSKAADARCEAR